MPLAASAVDEVVQHAAQAGEALERAQLEELVEQERDRLVAGRARPREEVERRVERRARARAVRAGDENGDAAVTALQKRSGVVAVRSTSMYCDVERPTRSRTCCSSVVRPLPQPPSRTGIREGVASSAAMMRRVSVVRGVIMSRASDSRKTRTLRSAASVVNRKAEMFFP